MWIFQSAIKASKKNKFLGGMTHVLPLRVVMMGLQRLYWVLVAWFLQSSRSTKTLLPEQQTGNSLKAPVWVSCWICCSCFIQETMQPLYSFINSSRPSINYNTLQKKKRTNGLASHTFEQKKELSSWHHIAHFWPESTLFNEDFPCTCLYIEHLTRPINSQHVGLVCGGLWLNHHPIDPYPCSLCLHGP